MRRARVPIQIQIALLVSGLILGVLVLADGLSYIWVRAQLRQLYLDDLKHDWHLAADTIRDAVRRPEDMTRHEVRTRILHAMALCPFPWAIVGPDGTGVASEPLPAPIQAHPPADAVFGVRGTQRRQLWAYSSRLRLPEGGPIRFVLWTSDAATNAALAQKLRRDLAIGVVVLVLVFPFSLWMARRILEPVRRLSEGARSMDAAALHARLPARDVRDDLGHLTDTLNALLQRIEDSMRGIQAFTGNAAHQLRTPLTVLKIELENAIDRAARAPDTFDALDCLDALQVQVQRLIHLANNLMLISESDAQGVPLTPSQVVLEELVTEIIELAAPLADAHRIALQAPDARRATRVLADRTKLGLALMNLVDNGIRYTPCGGSVWLRIEAGADQVSLQVGGSGPAIEGEDRARIFERFYRGATSTGGGLGLAIARSVVAAHGGTLALVEENVFELRLPAAPPGDPAEA